MVATTLSVGQIAIIGVNSEDTGNPQRDAITFMLLSPIGSGTQIFFTDRNWNGSTFAAAGGSEGTFTYTAGVDLPAGTVITITQAQLTGAGIDLSDAGETVYAYQGAVNEPSRFLHAVDIADGTAGFDGSELANTGLTSGVSAVSIAVDNGEFGTRTNNINYGELFAQINNATDWVQNDNSPQDGTSAGPTTTAPDAQIWVAGSGAGEAIVTINLDGTYSSGSVGYQIVHAFQNASQLFHPSDITLDTVNDKYFFVDADLNGNNRIIQGSISELLANPGAVPNFTVLYSNTGSSATGSMRTLSIDPATQKIYFDVEHSLLRINYDTQAQAGTVLATLDPDAYITQLTINYATGTVYLGSSSVTSVFGSDMIDTNRVFVATGLTGSNAANSLSFSQINWGANGDSSVGGEGNPLPNDSWPVERGTVRGVDVDPVTGKLYIVTGTVILDNDGNGLTTYYGGVWVYDPSNGSVTNLYTQNGSTGPVGLLYYIEVDNATGSYYVIDETGTNGGVGDGGVYRGSLTVAGTPTLLATVGNINGLGPQGLEIQHAPTLVGAAIASVAVTEATSAPASGETSRVALYSGLTASDIDTPNSGDELRGALVRVSGNFQAGATHQDILTINGTQSGTIAGSGIAYSYNQANGQMTLSGVATVAEYAAAIALVNFSTSGDNVTAFGTAGTRTISASVFDGLLYSDEINNNVTVTGINDAPVNSVSGAQSFAEDGARTFNAANGNLISVSDVDADPTSQSLQVTVAVAHGTLTLSGTAGLSFSVGDGTGDATMTFTGTANAINAALNGLVYTPTLDYHGADTLTLTTNDLGLNGNDPGLTGTGTSEQDSDTVAITVTAVADIANDVLNIAEDAAIASVAVQANDTFENSGHAITAFTQGAHGTVVLNDNGTAGNFADDFLQYTANADYNGTDSFTYTVTSGGATETATVNVTLSAVADIASDSVNLTEDAGATTLDVLANDSFEDPNRAITAVGSAAHGIVTINDNGTPGVGSDDYIVYTPTADYNGTDSFTYTVTSGGVTETATVTVNLSAVADIANDTVSVLEDSGANTLDLLGNDNFENFGRAITAVGSALHGTVSINNNGTVGNTADDYVVYTPTANYRGSDSFTYTVTSGGVTETATANITVTAVNDAPTIANVQGDNAIFIEGGAPVRLDASANAALADLDSADFNGGSLTVSITGGKVAGQDVLGIDTGTVTVAGGVVSVGGQAIGTVTGGGAGGGDLAVNFDTANATAARVQALIAALNFSNSDTVSPTGGTRTVSITLVDGDGRTNGGDDDVTVTTTVTVTPINDAPAGGDGSGTIGEDAVFTFAAADFSFSDVDGNAFAGVVLTTLPASGTIRLNGVAISAGTFVSAANIASNLLSYTPDANENGTPFDSFTFQVRDNGGTGNGGVDTDQTPNTFTFDVTPLNDAPLIANLNGDTAIYTENGAPLLLDVGSNAVIMDVDSVDFEAGTLTITINAVGDDALSLAAGTVTVDNSTLAVSVSGVEIGTLLPVASAPNYGFTIALNANATPARVQEVIRAVQYSNTGDDPTAGSRTVTFTLFDGDGSGPGETSTIILQNSFAVLAVNDPPIGIDKTIQVSEDDPYAFFLNDFAFSDAEADDWAEVIITTLPGNGELLLNGVAVTAGQAVSRADINAGLLSFVPDPDETGDAYASFTFQVRDDGGTADGGVDLDATPNTITIDVNPDNLPPVLDLNGAPAGIDNSGSYSEGGGASVLAPAALITDADDTDIESARVTITGGLNAGLDRLTINGATTGTVNGITIAYNATTGVLTLTGTATLATYQALLRQVGFDSASEAPGTSRTLTWTVNDGVDDSPAATTTIAVTSINDLPAGTSSTIVINEDAARTLSAADFGFSDVDGSFATVTIGSVSGGKIFFDADGAGAGAAAEVTLPRVFTSAELAGGWVSFVPTAEANGAGLGSISFAVTDNEGGSDASPNSLTIDVTAVNDAPTLSAAAPVSATEQTAIAVLSGVSVADVDLDQKNGGLGDYAGAVFSVNRNPVANAQDVFSLVAGSGFTVDGNQLKAGGLVFGTFSVSATGFIQISFSSSQTAATSALVDQVIQSIRYLNSSDTPPASIDLAYGFTDGSPGQGQGSGATNLDVELVSVGITAVNDAPINTLLPTQAGVEDSNVVFSTANANAISVADAEATTLQVTLSVSHGVLTLAGAAGLSFTIGDGTGDATMTFSGTASAINTALDGLVYRGALNYHGADALTVTTSDLGVAGSDGTKTDQDIVTINLVTDGFVDGDAGDNSMSGTGGPEQFLFQHGGNDHGDGGGGNDRFYFGDQWNSGDSVDGGAGEDSLQLAGDYVYTFGENQMVSIERLRLNTGGGADFDYYLTMANGNVAAGQQLLVDAQGLVAGETLTFVGIAETNGFYKILSGAGDDILAGGTQNDIISGGAGDDTIYGMTGNDTITGGLGHDILNGGSGSDVFVYGSAAESTSTGFDTIEKFSTYVDRIDLPFAVTGWSGTVTSGGLSTASFDSDLAAAVNGALNAHSAVLFTASSGTFSGRNFAVIDGNGDGSYQGGQDYVIEFAQPVAPLDAHAAYFI